MTRDGFVTELVQNQVSSSSVERFGTDGLTRLRSHAAAESYARFTFGVVARPGPVSGTSAQVRFVRFAVPNVPGAAGVAEITRNKLVAHANVEWVEGDCMIQLGDGVASHTPLTVPLVTAAQDIYKRTTGACS